MMHFILESQVPKELVKHNNMNFSHNFTIRGKFRALGGWITWAESQLNPAGAVCWGWARQKCCKVSWKCRGYAKCHYSPEKVSRMYHRSVKTVKVKVGSIEEVLRQGCIFFHWFLYPSLSILWWNYMNFIILGGVHNSETFLLQICFIVFRKL